jgi:hypothetical protein
MNGQARSMEGPETYPYSLQRNYTNQKREQIYE